MIQDAPVLNLINVNKYFILNRLGTLHQNPDYTSFIEYYISCMRTVQTLVRL